jgi:SecD/SecF fusion protein
MSHWKLKSITEVKPVVKDSLSALLTDAKILLLQKRKNPLFDKIVAQGGGPVLTFSQRYGNN